ncbi:hypothetical protein [Rhodococcus sp. IEGM 1379]|uniref:hypothetical protein n=1 Tax=Rhodococcus sp. IEGM 1379 TaxID=3047086 RepID=UPI0024B7930F|nr:hypothetical protein [Rhodococcus sp. IEGM 1379]MDI9914364.1 hypothetical protein [Rhodococcus sp. IEGM 1379]
MPSIIPEPEQVSEVARTLLDAADLPDDVRTDTSGPRLAFVVSDELATRAGFGEYDEDPEPAAEPDTEIEIETALEQLPEANPAVDLVKPETVSVEEPPRSGKGSGEEAWKLFLKDQEIEFADTLERNELIALWDAHQQGA